MKLFLSRAVKYIIRMSVIIGLIFLVLWVFGLLNTWGSANLLEALFMSWRGWILVGLLVLLAMLYPSISFARIKMHGSIDENRDQIMNAFTSYNFVLDRESEGRMEFRAKSRLKRVLWQFDDRVIVTQDGKYISIEGLKKIVPRVEVRLGVFIGH